MIDILNDKAVAKMNHIIFTSFKKDYFSISETIQILNKEYLPGELVPIDNLISIREISKYLISNDLKPHIIKD